MKTRTRTWVCCLLITSWVLACLAMTGCGDDDITGNSGNGIEPQIDSIPPAVVTDLRLRSPTQQSFALVWTAPGDDGNTGQASVYEIRYSKSEITEENWDEATPVDQTRVPVPKPSGEVETTAIIGLEPGTQYFCALKAADEVPNESGLSNCADNVTSHETTPPADVTDLKANATELGVFELVWTASGDDGMTGTAAQYDIRYSVRPITDAATWETAIRVPDPPTPKPAGEIDSVTVSGMTSVVYFFALKTKDELGNWSNVSNIAPGLKYGEIFWPWPSSISVGESMFIVFRAHASDNTRVSLQETFWWWEDVFCGAKLVTDIIWEALPEGTYMVEFDFYDEDTQSYFPPANYTMSLCYDRYGLQEYKLVFLNE